MIATLVDRYDRLTAALQALGAPLLLLALRLWTADAFFGAGRVKLANWDSTLFLFQTEYRVPLLPADTAAGLAAAIELGLPPLLALGLGSRPVALLLFGFNAVAVLSYPRLWEQGFVDHQLWGLMLLVVLLWGPGPWSLDRLLRRRWHPGRAGVDG